MPALRTIVASSRAALAKQEQLSQSSLLQEHFGLEEGDYVQVMNKSGAWEAARILSVRDCYANGSGGWTADLQVARLNRNGKVGMGRGLTVVMHKGRVQGMYTPDEWIKAGGLSVVHQPVRRPVFFT